MPVRARSSRARPYTRATTSATAARTCAPAPASCGRAASSARPNWGLRSPPARAELTVAMRPRVQRPLDRRRAQGAGRAARPGRDPQLQRPDADRPGRAPGRHCAPAGPPARRPRRHRGRPAHRARGRRRGDPLRRGVGWAPRSRQAGHGEPRRRAGVLAGRAPAGKTDLVRASRRHAGLRAPRQSRVRGGHLRPVRPPRPRRAPGPSPRAAARIRGGSRPPRSREIPTASRPSASAWSARTAG